jgi:hypothetical protein
MINPIAAEHSTFAMHRQVTLSLIAAFAFIAPIQGAESADYGRSANSPCVRTYWKTNYSDEGVEYPPWCNNNCYVYDDFKSVEIKGILYGAPNTDCIFYYDTGCRNAIPGHTHDEEGIQGARVSFGGPTAKAIKCFYDC